MTSGLSPCSALSLVRQRIHALRQFTELFFLKKKTHIFFHVKVDLSLVVDIPVMVQRPLPMVFLFRIQLRFSLCSTLTR